MNMFTVNWLAIVTCVIVSMIIGSVWFSQKTFFPIWWKAIGKNDKDEAGQVLPMGLVWGLTLLASFLQALFMAFALNAVSSILPGGVTIISGLLVGFIIWLGFVGPAGLTNKLFAGQVKAWGIETGNAFLVLVAYGAILGAWR
jgi:hypothetical protein